MKKNVERIFYDGIGYYDNRSAPSLRLLCVASLVLTAPLPEWDLKAFLMEL